MDIEDICTYGIVVKALAPADTHASASKQAAQLSPRAPLTAKIHRTICLSFAMPALYLSLAGLSSLSPPPHAGAPSGPRNSASDDVLPARRKKSLSAERRERCLSALQEHSDGAPA